MATTYSTPEGELIKDYCLLTEVLVLWESSCRYISL